MPSATRCRSLGGYPIAGRSRMGSLSWPRFLCNVDILAGRMWLARLDLLLHAAFSCQGSRGTQEWQTWDFFHKEAPFRKSPSWPSITRISFAFTWAADHSKVSSSPRHRHGSSKGLDGESTPLEHHNGCPATLRLALIGSIRCRRDRP